MVNSEEIVERTFYISLLNSALKRGLTLNPNDYLPLSPENESKFKSDRGSMEKFIPIFGIGNNQVRGAKTCPRITLELQGYYPGNIGVEKFDLDKSDKGNYHAVEYPFETKDITIDVHLVSNLQSDMRILHSLMYEALPSRGFLKPYYNDLEEWRSRKLGPSGNLYIEVGNYYDHSDVEHGILEKVYQYTCVDGLLEEKIPGDMEIIPITDISVLIGLNEDQERDMLNLHIP